MGYAINPAAIFDFANHTTHTDTYTFSKSTYTKPRNFAPSRDRDMASKTANPYTAGESRSVYTVKKGDTLSSIARSYGISTTTLRKLNNLTSTDRIRIGQSLKLK